MDKGREVSAGIAGINRAGDCRMRKSHTAGKHTYHTDANDYSRLFLIHKKKYTQELQILLALHDQRATLPEARAGDLDEGRDIFIAQRLEHDAVHGKADDGGDAGLK